ncbi:MAG: DUF981 family protein [Thermoplasmataceae archaeon]
MPFIDDLALELVSLAMLSGIVAYVTGLAYLEYRKDGPKNVENTLRLAVFPLGFLGAVITVLALWQEMTWPFPGGSSLYNIAFSDTYLVLGIIALAVALSLALRQKLQLVGFLALLGGIMAIYYGSVIYHYGYTQSPIATLGMYVAFGIAGILTYPATYAFDSMQAGKKPSMYFGIALILFWLFFIFAAVMAGIIGVPAVLQHLGSPP